MVRYLQEHFEQSVGDDPGVPPREMARTAIVEGARLRRRRNRRTAAVGVAAAVVVVTGVVTGLNLSSGGRPADPPVTVAAAMMPVTAPACTLVQRDATDAVVFLDRDLTVRQRAALETALSTDPRVAVLVFEGRGQAYERFQALWAHNPDLVKAVSADQFPESFRLRLVAAAQYTAVRSAYATMAGVEMITGRRCPSDAPVGGVL